MTIKRNKDSFIENIEGMENKTVAVLRCAMYELGYDSVDKLMEDFLEDYIKKEEKRVKKKKK